MQPHAPLEGGQPDPSPGQEQNIATAEVQEKGQE